MPDNNTRSLTEGPILSNLIYIATPLIFSSLLSTTQNLIDIFWVGRLGKDAIAAVALSGSIIMLLFPLAVGIGMGTISLVARYTGAMKNGEANSVGEQSILLSVILSAIIAAAGYIYAPSMLRIMGAPEHIAALGTGYLRVTLLGTITVLLLFGGNAILQGIGDTFTPMKAVAAANLLNLILDPVFIFGIGVPRMGVTGAAAATVISQAIASVMVVRILVRGDSAIRIRIEKMRPDMAIMRDILRIGIPTSVQIFARSLMMLVLMSFVTAFGTAAAAAYGIGIRLNMVFLMPAFALGGAAATMMGQNLGAGEVGRARDSALAATLLDLAIMIAVSAVFFVFAEPIMRIFNGEPDVIMAGADFMRITSPFYAFVAFGIVLNRSLAGAGDTFAPMLITLISLWLFQVPLAYMLSHCTHLGVNGIWWSVALTPIMGGLATFLWFETGNWKKGHPGCD